MVYRVVKSLESDEIPARFLILLEKLIVVKITVSIIFRFIIMHRILFPLALFVMDVSCALVFIIFRRSSTITTFLPIFIFCQTFTARNFFTKLLLLKPFTHILSYRNVPFSVSFSSQIFSQEEHFSGFLSHCHCPVLLGQFQLLCNLNSSPFLGFLFSFSSRI